MYRHGDVSSAHLQWVDALLFSIALFNAAVRLSDEAFHWPAVHQQLNAAHVDALRHRQWGAVFNRPPKTTQQSTKKPPSSQPTNHPAVDLNHPAVDLQTTQQSI